MLCVFSLLFIQMETQSSKFSLNIFCCIYSAVIIIIFKCCIVYALSVVLHLVISEVIRDCWKPDLFLINIPRPSMLMHLVQHLFHFKHWVFFIIIIITMLYLYHKLNCQLHCWPNDQSLRFSGPVCCTICGIYWKVYLVFMETKGQDTFITTNQCYHTFVERCKLKTWLV